MAITRLQFWYPGYTYGGIRSHLIVAHGHCVSRQLARVAMDRNTSPNANHDFVPMAQY